MKTIKTVVLMFVALATVGSLQAQNLLANGSFEQSGNSGTSLTNGGFFGWTVSGGANGSLIVSKKDGTEAGRFAAVFNNTNSPATAVLSQQVATTVGDYYTLTFFYGGYTTVGSPGVQSLDVQVIGASTIYNYTNSPVGTYANPAPMTVAQEFTEEFQATSSLTTIKFTDVTVNTTKSDGVLDDVQLTLTAVPEPSTLAMSAVGGLFSVLALRRRK